MIEIDNFVSPSQMQWMVAIRGMRNPFKATEKSDSYWCSGKEKTDCKQCDFYNNSPELAERYCSDMNGGFNPPNAGFVLGEEDKKLLLNLCKAGNPSHRKVLRQLPIIMDIKAPLYFWKELDQYKVGTCTNSESTMHTLSKRKLLYSDFDFEALNKLAKYEPDDQYIYEHMELLIEQLISDWNYAMSRANEHKEVWLETQILHETLFQSYKQKRTFSTSIEGLLNIIIQRINHRNKDWQNFCIACFHNVPLLLDIAEALGIVEIKDNIVCRGKNKNIILYEIGNPVFY